MKDAVVISCDEYENKGKPQRIIVICGVHASPHCIAAIARLASVNDVVIVKAVDEAEAFAMAMQNASKHAERMREILQTIVDKVNISKLHMDKADCSDWKRERDYPTLREGMRRKQINNLRCRR